MTTLRESRLKFCHTLDFFYTKSHMGQIRSIVRGRYHHVVRSPNQPILARVYGCTVDKAPYTKNGKTYVSFDTTHAVGDLGTIRDVDNFVYRQARISFSPVWTGCGLLIVKIPPTARFLSAAGSVSLFELHRGDVVDIEVEPGAYGSFGYCWLLRRIKTSQGKTSLKTQETAQEVTDTAASSAAAAPPLDSPPGAAA